MLDPVPAVAASAQRQCRCTRLPYALMCRRRWTVAVAHCPCELHRVAHARVAAVARAAWLEPFNSQRRPAKQPRLDNDLDLVGELVGSGVVQQQQQQHQGEEVAGGACALVAQLGVCSPWRLLAWW